MRRAPVPDRTVGPALRQRAMLALLPLSTGAAVVLTILVFPTSLLWPALVLATGAGVTAGVVAWRLPANMRRQVRRRLRTGLLAGLVATLAYDGVRWLLVVATPWSVDPFAAFPLFGRLLIGDASPAAWWAAGTVFHVLNGLGFAVGYTLVVRRPGLVSAVVWAMVLETFTILLYPDWLGVTAIGELFSISVLGHVAYGLALGQVARSMIAGDAAGPDRRDDRISDE